LNEKANILTAVLPEPRTGNNQTKYLAIVFFHHKVQVEEGNGVFSGT